MIAKAAKENNSLTAKPALSESKGTRIREGTEKLYREGNNNQVKSKTRR